MTSNLFEKSPEHFGGKIDFVLHSIGMRAWTYVNKGKHYTEMNYEEQSQTGHQKCHEFTPCFCTAWHLDALNDGVVWLP